ncbi:MAG: DNA polymerase III subunit delta' [Actinomycetes bacterium]
MTVYDDLVGQQPVVDELRAAARAAAGARRGEPAIGMTHAWLFIGPPGSGRSSAARAFAAALQCPDEGCGHCQACHTVLEGSHADVEVVATDLLSISIEFVRGLVRRAAMSPSQGRWQVIVVEDVDRLGEDAASVLLKSIEEPTPRTVWLLCAPSIEDVFPTIRSRCRHLLLRTPPADAVTDLLVRRDGVDPAMAAYAARASQGHIGRARRLATDEKARFRRDEVLGLPLRLTGVGACVTAAANLVDQAADEAAESSAGRNEAEVTALRQALGDEGGRKVERRSAAAVKDLERRQKSRDTRLQRDALDRALLDLASFYRDVLLVQNGADVALVNEAYRPAVTRMAERATSEDTLRRVEAVLACREQIALNVDKRLAVEAMALALRTS